MNRKRIVTIFILAMLAAAPGAQAQHSWELPRYVTGMHTAGSSNAIDRSKARGLYRQRTMQTEERSGYHSVANGENEFYLFDDAGIFQYLGEIKQAGGNVFPSGRGIDRSAVTNPETGVSEFVYRIGPWKRGSRHGVFLVKLPDGTYCQERWKWNRFKGVLPDEPSSDDIARIEESAVRLETMLRITDR